MLNKMKALSIMKKHCLSKGSEVMFLSNAVILC